MEEMITRTAISYEAAPGVPVTCHAEVKNGELSEEEIKAYIAHGCEKYTDKVIDGIEITLDGEFVDLKYHFADVPFERIRRITGYLVGTLDRFNNAKRAEVVDRVKHSCCC